MRNSRAGMSLVEVMVAMTIFTMLAVGITASVIQSQVIAQNNIVRNTAYTVAQGYLEQIKSLSLAEVEAALADTDETPLPTMSVSALKEDDVEVEDPLFLDGPDRSLKGRSDGSNFREILIDLQEKPDGTARSVVLDTWFDVDITPVEERSYSHAITVHFEVALRGAGERVMSGALRGLRADVNSMKDDG